MQVPDSLIQLSRRLADPAQDLVILAEGNTSCRDGDDFWVKASGHTLHNIGAEGFVKCRSKPLLDTLTENLSDDQVREVLLEASSSKDVRPSVESFMHAWLLSLPGVDVIGHVHATPVLALVSSTDAKNLCNLRHFPDEVVCCGPATAWVPYVDPGLPLAVEIKNSVTRFIEEHGEAPKVIWMQNHGLIALGRNALEVESAILMNVKAARMILMAGTRTLVPLSPENIARIHSRPDEHHRQELLWKLGDKH